MEREREGGSGRPGSDLNGSLNEVEGAGESEIESEGGRERNGERERERESVCVCVRERERERQCVGVGVGVGVGSCRWVRRSGRIRRRPRPPALGEC